MFRPSLAHLQALKENRAKITQILYKNELWDPKWYHFLWAFGNTQCVFIQNLCNLGSVFFEGLKMSQWRSKHVALTIYYF